jgi:hypothetical protein
MDLGAAMWKRIVDVAACYYLDAGADPSERRLVEDVQAARDER